LGLCLVHERSLNSFSFYSVAISDANNASVF